AGDGVGQPFLPAFLLHLTVVAPEKGANISFDYVGHAGWWIGWRSVWDHRYLLSVPVFLWVPRHQGIVPARVPRLTWGAGGPDFAHVFLSGCRPGFPGLERCVPPQVAAVGNKRFRVSMAGVRPGRPLRTLS